MNSDISKLPRKGPVPDPETLAIQALGFIAADADALERFLAETGCDPGQVRERAADKAFLGGVLDFVLGWEPRLVAFAAEFGVAPEQVAAARAKLPGGEREW